MVSEARLQALLVDPDVAPRDGAAAPDDRRREPGTDRADSGAAVRLVRASSIPRERTAWSWEGRIPAGMGALIAGQAGVGKTALLGYLMARLTRGQLDGAWYGRPAHVVYIGAEDDPSTVLVPRLEAAGADPDRVHLLHEPALFQVSDADALAAQLDGLDDVALVVIDPLDAHLGDRVDSHRKAEVQRAFAGLVEALTSRHRCAVVGVAHLSKGDSMDVLRRVVGSVGFTTAARAVLAVGEHPDDPRDRVCALRKANAAAAGEVPALRFRVEGVDLPHPDGGEPIRTARVVVLGEEHGFDADSILDVPNAAERRAVDDAADWLADLLADGPVPYRELERLAAAAGISRATLHRAREAAGVRVERDDTARGRPSTWRLPVSSQPPGRHFVSPPRDPAETKPPARNPLWHKGSEPNEPISSHVSGGEMKSGIPAADDLEDLGAWCSDPPADYGLDDLAGRPR